jgi:hypothetical protein
MSVSDWINVAVAVGTLLLAWAAFVQIRDSRKNAGQSLQESRRISDQQVAESQRASREQLGIETWLHFQERFDTPEIMGARHILAFSMPEYLRLAALHAATPVIQEDVLNFFDDLGILLNEGFINQRLSESSFSYYANRWWEIVKPYVENERRIKEDPTLFDGFEHLREAFRHLDPTISDAQLRAFLEDERTLPLGR